MNLHKRINAFLKLGDTLSQFLYPEKNDSKSPHHSYLQDRIEQASTENPWFRKDDIYSALEGITKMLNEKNINAWLSQYPELKTQVLKPQKVGVVNAGNIPLVGFHDFLCVLISGNFYLGKLSSKDKILLPALRDILIEYEPEFNDYIHFEENLLKDFDAIIATGSDNTARYFHYYFGKYPNIIRKNRNGVAVIPEDYNEEDLKKLADDIFMYYGLGCRNVSKIFFPENFDYEQFFNSINHYYDKLINHHKYANNYDYHKSIFLMNKVPHLDNGFVLLKQDSSIASPISTIFFETYKKIDNVKKLLETQTDQIQCIVSDQEALNGAVPFGKAQFPELWDYADNVDTLKFLSSLNK
jgi:hypothetical protein